jgi:hypothetical protein
MTMLVKVADHARFPGDPKLLSSGPSSMGGADSLARGLGWFSIALGVTQIVAAEGLARALGMRGSEWLIRGYGVREIASGVACLTPNPQAGVASRVAGDALDVATLLTAAGADNPQRGNVQLALLAVAGITLLDLVCHQALSARHDRAPGPGRSYADRTGFPQGVAQARGGAAPDREAGDGEGDTGQAGAPPKPPSMLSADPL